jgi:hypothetical protein
MCLDKRSEAEHDAQGPTSEKSEQTSYAVPAVLDAAAIAAFKSLPSPVFDVLPVHYFQHLNVLRE